jgi:hypothetical protein
MGVPFFGSAIPLVMAAPLLVAALLFGIIYCRRRPRSVGGILLVTMSNLVLALLLVGGPGTVWTFVGRHWVNPPGLPDAAGVATFVVGLLIPPGVTVFAIRAIRRDRTVRTVPNGQPER